MKLCAAQIRPSPGSIESNIRKHLEFIDVAKSREADLVVFPELSLTGYEPGLARPLASTAADARLDVFQAISDAHDIVIAVGLPTRARAGIHIGMVVFQSRRERVTYSKQLLHPDELAFFARGEEQVLIRARTHVVAPAICYESLQSEHAAAAAQAKADVYLASVAKSSGGVFRAYQHYPSVAREHSMLVLMANCVGRCADFVGAGQSAIWNRRGEVAAQLDGESEGLVVIEAETEESSVVHIRT